MSRYIKESNKALSGLKVVTSDDAYRIDKHGNHLKSKMIFGEVKSTMPNFIVKEKKDKSYAFVDDVSELPKSTKKELVKHFSKKTTSGSYRKVAYLIKKESSIPKSDRRKNK